MNATINSANVRDVLLQLSRDRAPSRTPLADLALVTRSLASAGFAATPAARQYEIGRLVTEVVEHELRSLRLAVGNRARTTVERIRMDFAVDHRDLEAWSAVYHLYLRPDLNLGLRDLERLLGDRHRRTIQRRLQHGVILLVARLTAMERESLPGLREGRPPTDPSCPERTLIGAETVLAQVEDLLAGRYRQQIVALCGPGGIGKTALAHRVADDLTAEGQVADVLWLSWAEADRPGATDGALLDSLAERVRPLGGGTDLSRFLSRARYLVVVDGLDAPSQAPGAVATLARLPSTTPVLVTWRTGSSTRVGVQSVEVPPLAPEAGLRLLRRELIAQGLPDVPLSDDTEWLPIVAAAAGHPLAVCAAARQLRTSTVRQVADALYDARGFAGRLYREVWEDVFAGASETVRAVVQAVVAVRTSGSLVDTSAVSAATGIVPAALHDALVGAVDAGLLVPLGGPNRRHFAPALFVDRFLAAAMLHMPDRAAAVWDADDGHSTHVA